MKGIADRLAWFSGGEHQYMDLYDCMNRDTFWVLVTVLLDLTVAGGYVLIALHWWREQRGARLTAASRALVDMKNIFVFCGICGYIFIPIKMVWPAWRLYDIFLAVLAFYTWRYAWNARELRVIYHELTRSDQLIQDLEAAREESRRKSKFLNAISHDLRTPINSLALHSQLIEMSLDGLDLPDSERAQHRESIDALKAGVQAAVKVLDRFLAMGQAGDGPTPRAPASLDLDPLVRRVIDRYRDTALARGIELGGSVAPGLRAVDVSGPDALEQILSILVENALKFTRSGSVRVSAQALDQHVRFKVLDTGEGIAREHLDRIFEAFYQVGNPERDPAKGAGVGLSTARQLADQLGGTLTVKSRPGTGSCFELRIPGRVDGPDPGE